MTSKRSQIEEIKRLDRDEMFKPKKKEKISFFKKIGIIINGKKR